MNLNPRAQVTQPIDQSYRIIPLTHGQVALVDVEDYEAMSSFNWCAVWNRAARTFYARRGVWNNERKMTMTIFMHRQLLGVAFGHHVDHRDGNGTNNRRCNIREATPLQNMHNCGVRSDSGSGLKGVFLERRTGRWCARIRANYKRYNLGTFATPEAAHVAYIEAAKKLHCEFAHW